IQSACQQDHIGYKWHQNKRIRKRGVFYPERRCCVSGKGGARKPLARSTGNRAHPGSLLLTTLSSPGVSLPRPVFPEEGPAMRDRVLLCGLLFASTAPSLRAQDDEDKLVDGKKASEWVNLLRGDKQVAMRRRALAALEKAGPQTR